MTHVWKAWRSILTKAEVHNFTKPELHRVGGWFRMQSFELILQVTPSCGLKLHIQHAEPHQIATMVMGINRVLQDLCCYFALRNHFYFIVYKYDQAYSPIDIHIYSSFPIITM